jgi:hypothetical protein
VAAQEMLRKVVRTPEDNVTKFRPGELARRSAGGTKSWIHESDETLVFEKVAGHQFPIIRQTFRLTVHHDDIS